MEKKRKSSKFSLDECKEFVLEFFEKQKKFKNIEASYNELKKQFNSEMEDFFECNKVGPKLRFEDEDSFAGNLVVTRVQKSSVIFNADKLEKALGKELSQDVIIKRYEIIDMFGLTKYLKECGVDPKVFKSFLHVSKTVDEKELDKLEEIGKISEEQIKGCYTVKSQKPYFTVGIRKGQSDDG